MTEVLDEHVMTGEHFAGVGSQVWRDTYAFVPVTRAPDGLAVLAGSNATAFVQYESARISWVGEGSDFVRENPGYGKITAVAHSESVYEKAINERLPLAGLRMAFARWRATKQVCSNLGIDPKPHLKQPEYSGLKDHL